MPLSGPVFLDKVKKSQGTPKLDIYTPKKKLGGIGKGKGKEYTFKFGRESFADPTVSSLPFSLLGYSSDVVKHVKAFKIYFKDQSIKEFKKDFTSYYYPEKSEQAYEINDYIESEGTDSVGNYIVYKKRRLEASSKDLTRVGPWSFTGNGHDQLREVRGLMLFNLWISNIDVRDENNKVILRNLTPHGRDASHST